MGMTVRANAGPARLDVWSPWTDAGALLMFEPAPQPQIALNLVANGIAGPTLTGGRILETRSMGGYAPDAVTHVDISFNRDAKALVFRVGRGKSSTVAAITGQDLSDLFRGSRVSLTASTVGAPGDLQLSNYSVQLPHQRSWAVRSDDWRLTAAMLFAALFGLALLSWEAISRRRRLREWSIRARARVGSSLQRHRRIAVAAVLVAGGYLATCALSFGFGAHPFDIANEKIFAYVGRQYGPAQLYYLPSLVSPAWVWNGVPYSEASFPYEPTFAYLFTGIGWIHGLFSNVWGQVGNDAAQLEYTIKTVNVLFAVADAAAIYLILRELRAPRSWRLAAAGLFLINPAVWFSTSLWGQTHVISVFFVLVAIWLMERRLLFGAWLALGAAGLTRPQMLVLCLLLAIVLLRRFPWRETVQAVSRTVIVVFILMLPLTLATGPSLPIDIMVDDFRIQEAGGNEPSLTTVSQDAYSLWPLVTGITEGASGLQRSFTPSAKPFVGTLSYQRVSQLLTLIVILGLAVVLWIRGPSFGPGDYLPYLALGITAFLLLMTGLVATHFVLALPFLLLCRRQLGTVGLLTVAILWSATTFLSMYGDMGNVIGQLDQSTMPIRPSVNALTRAVIDLYSSDRMITTAVVANLCVGAWLAVATFRRGTAGPAPRPPGIGIAAYLSFGACVHELFRLTLCAATARRRLGQSRCRVNSWTLP